MTHRRSIYRTSARTMRWATGRRFSLPAVDALTWAAGMAFLEELGLARVEWEATQ